MPPKPEDDPPPKPPKVLFDVAVPLPNRPPPEDVVVVPKPVLFWPNGEDVALPPKPGKRKVSGNSEGGNNNQMGIESSRAQAEARFSNRRDADVKCRASISTGAEWWLGTLMRATRDLEVLIACLLPGSSTQAKRKEDTVMKSRANAPPEPNPPLVVPEPPNKLPLALLVVLPNPVVVAPKPEGCSG